MADLEHKESLRRKVHATLQGKPIKLFLNLATILMAILMDVAVVLGLITLSIAVLHWIVAAYLVFGSLLLIMASLPEKLRVRPFFKYFLFMSTYNGKSAFLIFVAVLLFGLGIFAIIVGVFMVLLAILHFLLWLLFRDLVTDDSSKESGNDRAAPLSNEIFTDYTYSGALGGTPKPDSGLKIGGYEVATTIEEGNKGGGGPPILGGGPSYGAIGGKTPANTDYSIPSTYDSSSDSDEEARLTK